MRDNWNSADLFAWIWNNLAANPEVTSRLLHHLEAESDQVTDFDKRALRDLSGQSVEALVSHLANENVSLAIRIKRMILVGQAVDSKYEGFGLLASDSVSADRARLELGRRGRFNLDESLGQVIPKLPSSWQRSASDLAPPFHPSDEAMQLLGSAFNNLMVVPCRLEATDPDDCGSDSDRSVDLLYRIMRPEFGREPQFREGDELVIGFASLASAADDIEIDTSVDGDVYWYDARARELGQRAAEAVAYLCEAGAHIIIFPEVAMHPLAHDALRVAIRRHGSRSSLRFVVAGSTPREREEGMPFNETVLYDFRGIPLGRQRKMHRWNLDEWQRRQFSLEPHMPSEQRLFEAIEPGDEVTVFELPGVGRLIVMICEDLSRSQPGTYLLENFRLDWVFTPILDRSIEVGRWMHNHGERTARGGNCRVVICNSISLTHRANSAGAGLIYDDCGAGLCIDWLLLESGSEQDVTAAEPRFFLWRTALDESSPCTLVRWHPHEWPAHDAVNA